MGHAMVSPTVSAAPNITLPLTMINSPSNSELR